MADLTTQRERLRPGDRVAVREDDGQIVHRIVKQEPWQLGYGAWVVGLHGVSGGYDLSRVLAVFPPDPRQETDRG